MSGIAGSYYLDGQQAPRAELDPMLAALDQAWQLRRLLRCAQIARAIPLYRLRRPRVLALLPEAARYVEEFALQSVCAMAGP